MLRDFSDFYFEFEDKVAKGEYTKEQADEIFKESYLRYLKEDASIEIPKEDPDGFAFYVKLLNTDIFPRKKYKFLVKKVSSVTDANLSYTGTKDPLRYWVGPFETQKEAITASKSLATVGIKSKVEKWTPQLIRRALEKEDASMKAQAENSTLNNV